MTQQSDWLPSGRSNQLFMVRTWISVFTEDTPNPAGSGSTPATVKQYTAWGMSAETCQKPLAFGLEFAA